MVIRHKDQRVGVFIDAQNLYHSAKNLYHRKVNFGEVVRMAVGDRKLIRSIAYVIASDSDEEKGFFDALVKAGIETKIKDLQVFSDGAKKADWDVGLAIDCVKHAAKLDVIIIISGDGDFVPAIEYMKTGFGCQVEVVSFGRSSSGKLKEAVDMFIDLDLDPYPYLITPRGQNQQPQTSARPEGRQEPRPVPQRTHAQGEQKAPVVKAHPIQKAPLAPQIKQAPAAQPKQASAPAQHQTLVRPENAVPAQKNAPGVRTENSQRGRPRGRRGGRGRRPESDSAPRGTNTPPTE
jgi:uncharacterized LabA/DUF88 family protein